jgi:hypothetical protein
MSEVRVPIEKEYDNPKRRPGAGNFNDLLAGGGCLPAAGANPHSVMSSFIDEAFEDCKLDDNELAAMKVLAGMTPAGQPAAPQPECRAPSQPAPPDKAPCEGQTPAGPATCPPVDEHKPTNFNTEVARTLDKSKDWDFGEQMAADTAQRLINASSEQQMAFLDELWDLMSDDDIDEANDGEGSQLDAFVDGLFAVNPSRTGASKPGEQSANSNNVVREFLCQAMRDNTLSDRELAGLRALLGGSSAEKTARPERLRNDRPDARPAVDRSTTELQRLDANMDWLVRIGAISIDVGEGVKARSRHQS